MISKKLSWYYKMESRFSSLFDFCLEIKELYFLDTDTKKNSDQKSLNLSTEKIWLV